MWRCSQKIDNTSLHERSAKESTEILKWCQLSCLAIGLKFDLAIIRTGQDSLSALLLCSCCLLIDALPGSALNNHQCFERVQVR
jgi:hypothetical protein